MPRSQRKRCLNCRKSIPPGNKLFCSKACSDKCRPRYSGWKGKHLPEEIREKIRKKMQGRPGPAHKFQKGNKPPWTGKSRGQEFRELMRKVKGQIDLCRGELQPHYYKQNYHFSLKKLETRKDIIQENRIMILQYLRHRLAQGIGPSGLRADIDSLVTLSSALNKSFAEIGEEDLEDLMIRLNQSDNSLATIEKKSMIIKAFLNWLGMGELTYSMPKIRRKKKVKFPEELLTQDDIQAMINSALFTRAIQDAAFVAVLGESGQRIGEMLSLRLKHLEQEENGIRISIPDAPGCKTGTRRILVVKCLPYLKEWLRIHPYRGRPTAPLWVRNSHKGNGPMRYHKAQVLIARLVRRAGIKKRVYAHLFRHSAASRYAKYMTESQLKQYFGWTQGSKMCAVYIHMSGKDTDDAILRINGNDDVQVSGVGGQTPDRQDRGLRLSGSPINSS